MGEKTKIGWTDHTFNPWWGCRKVSAACKKCYAGRSSEGWPRFKPFFPSAETAHLGDAGSPVWRTGPDNWKQPRRWNRKAQEAGRRSYVFCASMSDVFLDHPLVHEWQPDLWQVIRDTPWLIWLLLTKRPEHVAARLPADWGEGWEHVKIGVTVENAGELHRLTTITSIPCRAGVFVSAEPLLSDIDFRPWLFGRGPGQVSKVDWLIGGGESQSEEGDPARPTHHRWARSLRDQVLEARAAGLPASYFFKQWGDWLPIQEAMPGDERYPDALVWYDRPNDPDDLPLLSYLKGADRTGNVLEDVLWEERPGSPLLLPPGL